MADFDYVPNVLEYAASDYGDYASDFNRQAGRLNSQAGRLNSLSSRYSDLSSSITDTALDRLNRYGEVSENDLVGNAVTDNSLAYSKAWDAAQRDLLRRGVNPNSGRFAGMSQSYALNRAAAEAGARNQMRLQARNENYQRANALAGLGYNYAGLGLNAANSATSAYNAANSAFNQAAGVQQNYGGMLSSLAAADRNYADMNDMFRYGRQKLGNQWGGTRTQAYAAAKQPQSAPQVQTVPSVATSSYFNK
jgi:hypothetical protein